MTGVADGVGTIRYDPGSPADGFLLAPNPINYFGNAFDSREGGPLSPGTITQFSWYHGATGGDPGAAPIAGPLGDTLSHYLIVTSVAPFAFNSVAVSWPIGSTFFAGLANRTGGSGPPWAFGSVGMRTASTSAQGFHGVQRSFGPASSTLPGQNVMVRIAGSIVVPVELIEFEVE